MHEKLIDRAEISQGRLLALRHDTVVDADGQQHRREVVVHRGGVAMVALTDDQRVLLVRQYRHAVGEVLLEIPAGTLDRLPDGGIEDPAVAAPRELAEETGQQAADWRSLGDFYTAPGFTTELMHLYLARQLSPVAGYRGPAVDEHLELEQLALADALARADAGEIRDAKTLVGLYRVARLLAAGRDERPSAADAG
jgi:ADP-ribose pyrophosphatase